MLTTPDSGVIVRKYYTWLAAIGNRVMSMACWSLGDYHSRGIRWQGSRDGDDSCCRDRSRFTTLPASTMTQVSRGRFGVSPSVGLQELRTSRCELRRFLLRTRMSE
jgi:hypothetical protein